MLAQTNPLRIKNNAFGSYIFLNVNHHLIAVSSSHTDSMKLEYQDWEAAQLLSNFHGMDTRMRNEETRDSVNIVTPR